MAIGATNFPAAIDSADTLIRAVDDGDATATTLSVGISDTDTTIIVGSTVGKPATGVIWIEGEYISYSSKTSTSYVVGSGATRGAFQAIGGAQSAFHPAGATVKHVASAQHHQVLVDALLALEAKLGSGASTPSTTGQVLTVTGAGATAYQALPAAPTAFSDAAFAVQDDGDATKQLKFQASGIATGTTRTLTAPNADLPIGGFEVDLGPFYLSGAAATATAVQMQVGYAETTTTFATVARDIKMQRSGRVVGIVLASSATITGGSATALARVAGSAVAFSSGACVLNTTNPTSFAAFDHAGPTFAAGDSIGVAVTTASLAPVTNTDLVARLIVRLDAF